MTTLSTATSTRRATMSDVARHAGVSAKTVSRVVNDEPGVHPSTADRVLGAIEELDFRRNLSARNLRRGTTTGTVGLILEDVANPFYSAMTRAVEEVARTHGMQVITGSSDEDPEREPELALELCARRVDGLLIIPAGARHGYLRKEIDAGTPTVFVDRPPGEVNTDTVLIDNADGVRNAVSHLAQYGHSRIAFLGDAPTIYTATERLRGFREGCAAANVGYDTNLVTMGPHTESSVAALIARFRDAAGPTALITGNNRITLHTIRALNGEGYRPALIGFDDFELADLLDPPVSVISTDPMSVGHTAARMLFSRMSNHLTTARRVTLPTQLVPRGSGEITP